MDAHGLARSLNPSKNRNFTLRVENFRRTSRQHNGRIVFARKTIGWHQHGGWMGEGRGRGSRTCWEDAAISPVVGKEALNEARARTG